MYNFIILVDKNFILIIFRYEIIYWIILGEHIDYNGYSVLPMTLRQSIYMAVGLKFGENQNALFLRSTNPYYE